MASLAEFCYGECLKRMVLDVDIANQVLWSQAADKVSAASAVLE
jgi:hypothetical protein